MIILVSEKALFCVPFDHFLFLFLWRKLKTLPKLSTLGRQSKNYQMPMKEFRVYLEYFISQKFSLLYSLQKFSKYPPLWWSTYFLMITFPLLYWIFLLIFVFLCSKIPMIIQRLYRITRQSLKRWLFEDFGGDLFHEAVSNDAYKFVSDRSIFAFACLILFNIYDDS